jgi:GTP-dependent dephospho-CoA kinase
VLILKKELRSEFKKPLGKLYSSLEDAEDFLNSKYTNDLLISVGDVTTRKLQETGLIPHMGIIDNLVERKPAAHDIIYDNVTLKVDNPAGTITDGLWDTIKHGFKLLRTGYRVLILVNGEEDLAVIPCVLMAPPGSLVLYGQPDEGLVVCEVDKVKEKIKELKARLEEE